MQITNSQLPVLALIACAGLLGSCNVLREATSPSSKSAAAQTDAVFTDLVRYADITTMRIQVATREFAAASKDPDAELQAATWRLDAQRFLTQTAGGPNSTIAMLDTVVLLAVTRWLHEDYWLPKVFGDPDRPMLDALANSEKDGWTLLERYLEKDVVKKAREVLQGWREQNPELTPVKLIEFPNFYTLVQSQKGKGLFDEGLLGMVGLDPLSGLEPMARQVELSRMLGLRALYFAQRAPRLVGSEIDLRVLSARETREWRQVLANLNDVTKSVIKFAATSEKLPEYVKTERENAVKQVNDALTAQREGIVDDLSKLKPPLDEILRNSQATLDAATHASTALTGTVTAVDGMLAGIAARGKEEPPPRPAGAPEPPPGKPFDPVEYGAMADHVGTAADRLGGTVRDVNALLATLDQRLPAMQKVLDETAARGKATIDRALLGLLGVGLALVAAWALASFVLRRVRPRAPALPPA
jgi:hypothetical protein